MSSLGGGDAGIFFPELYTAGNQSVKFRDIQTNSRRTELNGSIFVNFEGMKKYFALLLVFVSLCSMAQVKLYRGDSFMDSDIVYTIQDGLVYHGDATFSRKIVFTVSDNKVYIGRSTSSFDCLYSYTDKAVYRGDSRFITDMIYTIDDNKVYRGNTTFSTNCILTLEDDKIYMGSSTFSTDLLFTIKGLNEQTSLALLACIVGPY